MLEGQQQTGLVSQARAFVVEPHTWKSVKRKDSKSQNEQKDASKHEVGEPGRLKTFSKIRTCDTEERYSSLRASNMECRDPKYIKDESCFSNITR